MTFLKYFRISRE